MFGRIKVINTEVATPPAPIRGLEAYSAARLLFRLHGSVIGVSDLPVTNGEISAAAIGRCLLKEHSFPLLRTAFKHALLDTGLRPNHLSEKTLPAPPPCPTELPLITVAVCTRDRTADLRRCLASLVALDYPRVEVVLVDNAPSTDETKRLLQESYPSFRYVVEPKAGLNNARNTAMREANGEIVAYADDDVEVDPLWLRALGRLFGENPEVMASTGLVMPSELESEAQQIFELTGGFGRGFHRRWVFAPAGEKLHWPLLGTGQFGTGANMAFRRELFDKIGEFDPALDVGTCTNGGGDLEFLLRTLKTGNVLVYEPDAVVWHRHRRDMPALQKQMRSNGNGFASYFWRTFRVYPEERKGLLCMLGWCLFSWYLPRIVFGFYRPTRIPVNIAMAEFFGFLGGFGRYERSCREGGYPLPRPAPRPEATERDSEAIDIRFVEMSKPLQPLAGLEDFQSVELQFTSQGIPIGNRRIKNYGAQISASRLADEAQEFFLTDSRTPKASFPPHISWSTALAQLQEFYLTSNPPDEIALAPEISVSVVIATKDRPADLRRCLTSLSAQETPRPLEIIVVDNNPRSQETPKVLAEFPAVRLIEEPRRGPSYARNAGIRAASGEVILSIDDDVWAPADWVENLVAPFARADVAGVTGNVLPASLTSPSEQLFELYGGLSRGFDRWEADASWFESSRKFAAPTWNLGGTANAAFRASIFREPKIGFMDEALGPGTPTGVGEDTYLFYKILKAGKTILYEPAAWVRHHHRCSMEGVRKQIFNYSKGHTAYHLTTWLNDGDWRALYHLGLRLPAYWVSRIKNRLLRRTAYPLSFLGLEILGTALGPFVLWKSRREVRRLNNGPYASRSETSVAEPVAEGAGGGSLRKPSRNELRKVEEG